MTSCFKGDFDLDLGYVDPWVSNEGNGWLSSDASHDLCLLCDLKTRPSKAFFGLALSPVPEVSCWGIVDEEVFGVSADGEEAGLAGVVCCVCGGEVMVVSGSGSSSLLEEGGLSSGTVSRGLSLPDGMPGMCDEMLWW